MQWVGGSDWVILHRNFVHYLATADDGLVRGLATFHFYSVIATETFFHTALVNSRYLPIILRSTYIIIQHIYP